MVAIQSPLATRTEDEPWSRVRHGLETLGRGLGAFAAYLPGFSTTIALLCAPPEVRLQAVHEVRERGSAEAAAGEAITDVAKRLGVSAGAVGNWVRLAEREEARHRGLTARRTVRPAAGTGVTR